jgi:stearoyl-CoA desaturase (Delta-9 desaturase)
LFLTGADDHLTKSQAQPYRWTLEDIKWWNTIVLTWFHIASVYSLFDLPRYGLTYVLQFLISFAAGFGVTAGAHRYFTHRCYRVSTGFKYFLIFLQTLSAQEDILSWVRDHRVHHKFTDTDADPHNSTRGLFFSHMGWLLIKKHPDVKKYGSKVDMSDLDQDPVLLFQRK